VLVSHDHSCGVWPQTCQSASESLCRPTRAAAAHSSSPDPQNGSYTRSDDCGSSSSTRHRATSGGVKRPPLRPMPRSRLSRMASLICAAVDSGPSPLPKSILSTRRTASIRDGSAVWAIVRNTGTDWVPAPIGSDTPESRSRTSGQSEESTSDCQTSVRCVLTYTRPSRNSRDEAVSCVPRSLSAAAHSCATQGDSRGRAS
jgi:hypothetical protein